MALYQSINQSIFIWVRQKPTHTHTRTHACTKHNHNVQ